jgi:hypothetical protein
MKPKRREKTAESSSSRWQGLDPHKYLFTFGGQDGVLSRNTESYRLTETCGVNLGYLHYTANTELDEMCKIQLEGFGFSST